MFNGVVQLCILYLPDALKKYLKLSSETQFQAHKVKRFGKVKSILKSYLVDLIKVNIRLLITNIQTVTWYKFESII